MDAAQMSQLITSFNEIVVVSKILLGVLALTFSALAFVSIRLYANKYGKDAQIKLADRLQDTAFQNDRAIEALSISVNMVKNNSNLIEQRKLEMVRVLETIQAIIAKFIDTQELRDRDMQVSVDGFIESINSLQASMHAEWEAQQRSLINLTEGAREEWKKHQESFNDSSKKILAAIQQEREEQHKALVDHSQKLLAAMESERDEYRTTLTSSSDEILETMRSEWDTQKKTLSDSIAVSSEEMSQVIEDSEKTLVSTLEEKSRDISSSLEHSGSLIVSAIESSTSESKSTLQGVGNSIANKLEVHASIIEQREKEGEVRIREMIDSFQSRQEIIGENLGVLTQNMVDSIKMFIGSMHSDWKEQLESLDASISSVEKHMIEAIQRYESESDSTLQEALRIIVAEFNKMKEITGEAFIERMKKQSHFYEEEVAEHKKNMLDTVSAILIKFQDAVARIEEKLKDVPKENKNSQKSKAEPKKSIATAEVSDKDDLEQLLEESDFIDQEVGHRSAS